jgi:hypothetical protein
MVVLSGKKIHQGASSDDEMGSPARPNPLAFLLRQTVPAVKNRFLIFNNGATPGYIFDNRRIAPVLDST